MEIKVEENVYEKLKENLHWKIIFDLFIKLLENYNLEEFKKRNIIIYRFEKDRYVAFVGSLLIFFEVKNNKIRIYDIDYIDKRRFIRLNPNTFINLVKRSFEGLRNLLSDNRTELYNIIVENSLVNPGENIRVRRSVDELEDIERYILEAYYRALYLAYYIRRNIYEYKYDLYKDLLARYRSMSSLMSYIVRYK